MQITVAKNAGFCPGVNSAINKAIELSNKNNKKIFTLGQLIHNNDVIKELEKRGIKAIDDIDEIMDPQNSILVIRAHGITPQLEGKIKEKKIDYVDATCPLVKNLQKIIQNYKEKGYKTVIFGDKNHAEVIGLIGYAEPDCIVISSIEEAESLPPLEKVNLVSQTTQEEENFLKVAEILRNKTRELIVSNTICEPTRNRQKETRHFASNSDLVIVVGGKHSANTKRLYEICKNISKKAILVENENEITKDIFNNIESVFITAGASTPQWMIERVVWKVRKLTEQKNKISHLINFIISVGLTNFISFLSISMVSTRLLKITPSTATIISSLSALTLAHLINRLTTINNENIKTRVLVEYPTITKTAVLFLGGISILLSLKDPKLAVMILLFNIVTVFYRKIGKQKLKLLSIPKDIAITLGWLYIFVAVPATVSKPSLVDIMVTSIFISSLSIMRNHILKILYFHSDIIPDGESISSKNTKTMMYLLLTINALIPFSISHRIGWYFLISSVYYLILYRNVFNKKIHFTPKNEMLLDAPFMVLLGYLITI